MMQFRTRTRLKRMQATGLEKMCGPYIIIAVHDQKNDIYVKKTFKQKPSEQAIHYTAPSISKSFTSGKKGDYTLEKVLIC